MSDPPEMIVAEEAHIGRLRQDPNNARRHNPRNISMIERSISEGGAGRSVLTDRNGNLIAGNGVVEAAAQAGLEDAVIVRTRGDRLIIHQRDDLDINDPQAIKLALYDNRSAELAEWDSDILAGMADTDILGDLFYESELEDILHNLDRGGGGGGGGGDRPELPELNYRVVVEFDNEDEQLAFIEECDQRGIPARALTT